MFRNLTAYDGHLFLTEAFKINQEIGDTDVSAIPKSNEQFLCRKIGGLILLDDFAFLSDTFLKNSKSTFLMLMLNI